MSLPPLNKIFFCQLPADFFLEFISPQEIRPVLSVLLCMDPGEPALPGPHLRSAKGEPKNLLSIQLRQFD